MPRKAPESKAKKQTGPSVGGTFLRGSDIPSLLEGKADHLLIVVDDRPASKTAQEQGVNGPIEGRFGIDVPTHVGVAPYIVTLPDFTEDYDHLLEAWGDDMDSWVGRSLALWSQTVTNKGPSGDSTKVYLRFRPAEEVLQQPPSQQVLQEHSRDWKDPDNKAKKSHSRE